ncbi:DUF4145 domain-containing protein [Gluconobacter cerinus]|uniref:DUF4145 domain-containing protein n=1 Tax=Gluconobacter cerinus TaxID=38307 RepID=UPI0018DCA1E8|nr:DUF4145 domain-containing protein [Gluconobacter cerinus]
MTTQLDVTDEFSFKDIVPAPPNPDVPEFLPNVVERAFLEGERSRIGRNLTAAGMVFRKALENATRQKATEAGITENNLKRRIEKLAAAQKLTPDIAEWADHIRIIGNEAAHDEDEPTEADINALAALTRMTLIYLYEMPERVRRMREEAREQGAEV